MIALIQRPRRKKHLASTKPGLGYWATLCDRPIQLEGTDFAPLQDVIGTIDRNDLTVCIECARMVVFAHVLAENPYLLDGLPSRHLTAVAS
jgi:hypothetical protein